MLGFEFIFTCVGQACSQLTCHVYQKKCAHATDLRDYDYVDGDINNNRTVAMKTIAITIMLVILVTTVTQLAIVVMVTITTFY